MTYSDHEQDKPGPGAPLDRRAWLRGATGLSAVALLAAAGCRPKSKATALRVAVVGKGDQDPRTLFRAAGIKPDFPIVFSEFESGHLVVEAFNAGAIDHGGTSEIPPVFAAASTAQNFRQVAVLHGDVNNQVVLVPRGSPIHDLAGLKGKRIGYVRATTSQYFLIRMLQSVGLGWADITPVAMTVSDGAAAFAQGSLDAWAIYGFPIQRAIATQGARVLRTALGFLSGNYIASVHKEVLDDPVRLEWSRRYFGLQMQAFRWARLNADAWARIVAKEIGVPVEYVLDASRHRTDPWQLRPVTEDAIRSQQNVADVFSAAHLIPGHVDVRPLWDARFNSLIAKEPF